MKLHPKLVLLVLTVATLAFPTATQLQFDELIERSPAPDRDTLAIAVGDVDGDGDHDLVFGNRGQNTLYLNDGGGAFFNGTAARLPRADDHTTAVALRDVDGDGDPDLVCGNDGQANRLYLNNGTGIFTESGASGLQGVRRTRAMALDDVDGDGDPDLVFANFGARNRLYLNTAGAFVDATATGLPRIEDLTTSTLLGDVDGDGDPDLIFGNHGQQNRLLLNDGSGVFVDATAARMPPDNDPTHATAFGDVDGDGDGDLVFGTNCPRANRLYLNDGSGAFTDVTATQMPAACAGTRALTLFDVDSDGDRDLVFANRNGPATSSAQNGLYLNDGSGTFTDASRSRLPVDSDNSEAVVAADIDSDGDPDLVFGNSGTNTFYVNDAAGTFADVTIRRSVAGRMPFSDDDSTCVAMGDVDGDGDQDVVFGNVNCFNCSSGQNRLYLNDGTGRFSDVTAARMPAASDHTSDVALGDLDGDGDLDLIVGNQYIQNRLYLNDGTGRFSDATAARMPVDTDNTGSVVIGDIDGDLDPDLVFANLGQNTLYLNDGNGFFSDATVRMPPSNNWSEELALGDVDGDGDPDLVFANEGQQNRLYLNVAGGIFLDATAGRLPADTDFTLAVALGDVDGDGDADLVFGNVGLNGATVGQQDRLYLNDGSGTFTDATARLPQLAQHTNDVVLADVDEDGDPDMVQAVIVAANQQNQLYLNDGTGTFVDASAARMPPRSSACHCVVVGDVDGDGDPDLVFGTHNLTGRPHTAGPPGPPPNLLYLNLLRQLDTPLWGVLGYGYELNVYARYGAARPQDIAYVVLSSAAANHPWPPFGTLFLEPSAMVALPPVVIPQPAGVSSVSFVVPYLPSLAGRPLHTQALVLQPPTQARLTNPVADVLVR